MPDGTKEIKFPLDERNDTVCDLDTETESIFMLVVAVKKQRPDVGWYLQNPRSKIVLRTVIKSSHTCLHNFFSNGNYYQLLCT